MSLLKQKYEFLLTNAGRTSVVIPSFEFEPSFEGDAYLPTPHPGDSLGSTFTCCIDPVFYYPNV
jgi:hypothetical protein